MRTSALALTLSALSLAAACGGGGGTTAPPARRADATPSSATPAPSNTEIGVVSSHGGAGAAAPAAPGGTNAGAGSDRGLVDTKQLDERIRAASAKARQAGAAAADKQAAASAYLERGNVYYSAGQPRLYKYALADFREVLRYDPSNQEAKDKLEQIEDIYRNMGRPIPTVSADQ